MKLKYFSEQTVSRAPAGGPNGTAKITFSKNGGISINKTAQSLLGIGNKDKITLSQDEDEPENWYIHKDPHHGFEMRIASSGQLLFTHVNLVKTFKEIAELDIKKTYSFLIGGQPTMIKGDKAQTQYWGILIRR
ncbi:MAG: hypothetical protein ACTHMM_05525 [Agriterribacter sp.]